MNSYLFITYGEPGWRGVQMRALRVAKYLPKNEVLFWNLFDSEFIMQQGFRVETKHEGLMHPKDVVFPKNVKVVIFADLPTNEMAEYAIYQAALKRNLKIVIFELIYKRGQAEEFWMKKVSANADLMIANSLSAFRTEETSRITIVPPQIEFSIDAATKAEIHKRYDIPEKSVIIFGAGYHEQVFKKIKTLTRELSRKGYDFYTIVSGPSDQKKVEKDGRLIMLPFTSGDEYFKLLAASDVVLVKFGFLQILESLALHKPTIVLGEAGQVLQNPEVVDQLLRNVLHISDEVDEETFSYIEKLVADKTFHKKVTGKIQKLHDGELFGARSAAEKIEKLETKKTLPKGKAKKRLAILVNNEIFENEDIVKQENLYPLCIITPMPTSMEVLKRIPADLMQRPMKDLQFDQQDQILPHSFKHVFVFSRRKSDGLLDIFPWFEEYLAQIQRLIDAADEVYLTTQGEKIVKPLLSPKTMKKIVRMK